VHTRDVAGAKKTDVDFRHKTLSTDYTDPKLIH
jgi:hypothetical protein